MGGYLVNYQEAIKLKTGSYVLYRGNVTEVLSISQTSQHALYFRLAGVETPVNYAVLLPVPAILRRPA